MEEMGKMRVRLGHWLEHNAAHRAEFEKWAARLQEMGQPGVSRHMKVAAQRLEDVENSLQNALKELPSAG